MADYEKEREELGRVGMPIMMVMMVVGIA